MESSHAARPDGITLEMPDQVRVFVPRQIRHLSTFVLQEQGDWFEQEIKFLRRLVEPGMNVIDIGANYGLYTLALAKVVGEEGCVWAFEPASTTAEFLRQSIEINRFSNIKLIEKGLSDRTGKATFHLSSNSELNSLQPVKAEQATETIALTTLDHCLEEYDWPRIDVIKLDAEGEESRILQSAENLLRGMSPLVMFELKHAKQVNLPLIKRFSQLGYRSYRLVSGPGVLLPFDAGRAPDPYQLNLFCCKQDRADKLAERGLLVKTLDSVSINVAGRARSMISAMPFAARVENVLRWKDSDSGNFEKLMDFYVTSMDPELSPSQRVACLRRALVLSVVQAPRGGGQNVCPIEQVATHARIALDAGMRARAVQLLLDAIGSNDGVAKLHPQLPFLPASIRYDHIDPADRLNHWLVSSVIEQWVINHAYSSYFTAQKALRALERLYAFGFIDPAMQQRLDLVSRIKVNS